MAATPQPLGNAVLTVVNVPDFFGRASAYEAATVFVAEEDGVLAGSAAAAVRELLVGDVRCRVGYEFQYFTSPNHRRRGVAGRLRERIETWLRRAGAELTTAIIADSNPASQGLFAAHGFARHRDLSLAFLAVPEDARPHPDPAIRQATPDDLSEIAHLLNRSWAGHDLAPPLSTVSLAGFLRRTPGLGVDRLLIRTEGEEIVACAGLWDWSQVQRIELRPADPTGGSPVRRLRQWGLTPVGFRDPADLATLVRHVLTRAAAAGVEQIGQVGEPSHPLLRAVSGLPSTSTAIGLYVKPLRPGVALGAAPVFVDPIDL